MGQRRDALMDRAGLLPGWTGRAGRLPILQKAQGARVYDVDNVGFIDYTGAGGGVIVGHANQFVRVPPEGSQARPRSRWERP